MNISDDGKTITFKLREGTFHNGDDITSEDVKFTFELLQENSDVFVSASRYDEIDSISAPSDDTVVFNLTKPTPALVGREIPKWGILHKPSWEPAMDDPEGFQWEAPFIGSGPWEIESFESGGGQIIASPHDGNPILEPDHGLTLKSMGTLSTKLQAFKAGELDVITNIQITSAKNIVEDMGEENVEVFEGYNFMNRPIYPQMSNPPVNFKEFRKAAAMSLDTELIAELIFEGEVSAPEHQDIWSENHPWRPPEEDLLRIDPASNIEEARAELRDAGWGWDSQDRLHYPPDADTSPPWPKGEQPSPEDFPCIDSEGEWVHPDDR
jgi:peptide/nickel transport system substrate-binding protein